MNAAVIFAKVVEAKGFSSASRVLGLPKTTISKKVSELETYLGVRLLTRTTRSIALTEAGHRFYGHCCNAIKSMKEAEREAFSWQEHLQGTLRVAVASSALIPILLPSINSFMNAYPMVNVNLATSANQTELQITAFNQTIDVLIKVASSLSCSDNVRFLANVKMGLYASQKYVASYGKPAAPSEIQSHALVSFTPNNSTKGTVVTLTKKAERVQIIAQREPRFCSNEPAAIFEAVVAGFGIGLLPIRYVERLRREDHLQPILPEWTADHFELYAIIGDSKNPKAKFFADIISDWFTAQNNSK